MIIDPRVTPANDTAVPNAPGLQDNPSVGRLTVGRLGMEMATELGVDPNNLAAFGLTEEKINQYETQLHSGRSRSGSNR